MAPISTRRRRSVLAATSATSITRTRWAQQLPPGIAQVTAGAVQHNYDTTVVSRTFDFYAQEQFLTLDQRLALSAGITAERSTDNGNVNTYYPYPKFSASFRVPQFAGFLDELKLRGAWGRSGTDPIFGVRYANVNNLTPQLDQGVTGLFTPLSSNDPGIKPETNTEIETGFDATMFHSRAQFSGNDLPEADHRLAPAGSVSRRARVTTSQWLNGGQFTDRGIRAVTLGDARADTQEPDVDLHVNLLPELQRDGRAASSGIRTGRRASVQRTGSTGSRWAGRSRNSSTRTTRAGTGATSRAVMSHRPIG